MACLDTSAILDLGGRGGRRLKRRIQDKLLDAARRGERLDTTRFTLAELYVGIYRSKRPQDEQKRIADLLEDFEVLEFVPAAARLFGELTAALWGIGRPIGDMDALIAATPMAAGERLITRDLAHFSAVSGLRVEEY